MKELVKIGKKVFPLNRSLTGKDNLKTLRIFKNFCSRLKIRHFSSGKKVYDWKIPYEWSIKDAYIKDRFKKKIIDFKNNNLHVISYSGKVQKYLKKSDLLKKIYTNKKNKNAIPYVTSYYKKNWGFCITENQREVIKKNYKKNDIFKVVIKSNFKKKGKMYYGEIFIPGKVKDEILISTYICHPSMANNELSGPLVSLSLAKYFAKKKIKCGLRFVFVSETIGAISYINKNYKNLKQNVKGGYLLTCIGDERNHSLLLSKYGNSISDLAAKEAYEKLKIKYKKFSFLKRGSDERQYNSPYIDLGISSIMRTKHGEYKEYHTSLDKFDTVVTAKGLNEGFIVAKAAIKSLMNKKKLVKRYKISKNNPRSRFICEPFLTKRNIFGGISNLSVKKDISFKLKNDILNFLQYSDGTNSKNDISKFINLKSKRVNQIYKICKMNNLIN